MGYQNERAKGRRGAVVRRRCVNHFTTKFCRCENNKPGKGVYTHSNNYDHVDCDKNEVDPRHQPQWPRDELDKCIQLLANCMQLGRRGGKRVGQDANNTRQGETREEQNSKPGRRATDETQRKGFRTSVVNILRAFDFHGCLGRELTARLRSS
jgi:hypothetical protein